ncbi:hypothetical protein CR513_41540, partial [Mucuna pruriens]
MLASRSVLMKSIEGKDQHLVYFVNKILQGVETQYQKIQKAALALVITIRRLRPYFQSNQVLRKLNLAGRMVGWTVELLEFDISFEKRRHIKAQVLANFVTKLALTGEASDSNKEQTLLVDGASNQKGSRVRVILDGPNGVMI